VPDRFDVVAIRIEHKSCVVTAVVIGSEPGCTVVFAAGGKRVGMEGIDLLLACGAEGDVQAWEGWCSSFDEELDARIAVSADYLSRLESGRGFGREYGLNSEWGECVPIELAAAPYVRNLHLNVVKHVGFTFIRTWLSAVTAAR